MKSNITRQSKLSYHATREYPFGSGLSFNPKDGECDGGASVVCSYQQYELSLEVKVIKRRNDKSKRISSTGQVECMRNKIAGILSECLKGRVQLGLSSFRWNVYYRCVLNG
jgi:hypothetical protein